MMSTPIFAAAAALACGLAFTAVQSRAKDTDYRFELAGTPQPSAKKDTVQVRLLRVADGKPVPDAVIFESKADMGPSGMSSMTAPVTALPAKGGTYSFEVQPGMTGTWALHLAAKVQGEPDTVRATLTIDLVK